MSDEAQGGCLNEGEAAAYVHGEATAAQEERVRRHLAGCDDCRALLDAMFTTTGGDGEKKAAPIIAKGSSIGRYLVLEALGSGGMGVVFAAYDPQLDRKVAIKLLRSGGRSTEARERLVREAKAMARVWHPNVIAVHDVGTHGDQVFVTMELLEGSTLARWLHQADRSWREVLEVFLAAGRGLAAAHQAQLVHRDFKPENVLVGPGGRVCVTDFGLALEPDAPMNLEAPLAPAALGPAVEGRATPPLRLTADGAVVGTLAYMAPEQRQGQADARSDQYAFCVALWEALFKHRPDRSSGALRSPAGSTVPSRVTRALARGLSERPADRFESLEALLAELTPKRRAKGAVLLAAAAVVALSASGLLVARSLAQRQQTLCTGAERRLEGVWDPAARARVGKAFLATQSPLAKDALAGVERALDRYAASWTKMHEEACRATRIFGEQPEGVLAARMACLDGRLGELRSLVGVLEKADLGLLHHGVSAAHALTPLSGCADLAALARPGALPQDPATQGLRGQLGEAKALRDAGKYALARARVDEVLAAAAAQKNARHQAEALVQLGELQGLLGEFAPAEKTLHRALPLAEAAASDDLSARGLMLLLNFVGSQQNRFDEGRRYADQARAKIERLGGDDELLANWHSFRGLFAFTEEKYDEAIEHHQKALALRERLYGPEHPQVAFTLAFLGNAHLERGESELALGYYQRALALRRALLGPRHPSVGNTLANRASVLVDLGRTDEALASAREAVDVLEAALGKEKVVVAIPVEILADAQAKAGRCPEALANFQRAQTLLERGHGEDSPILIFGLVGIARCSEGEKARSALEKAVRLAEKEGATAMDRGMARAGLARVLAAGGASGARAQSLAALAETDFVAAGKKGVAEREELLGWREAFQKK